METTITEVLGKLPIQKLTLPEILETYNHIALTDDEITEAMIWAKRKKEESIRLQNIREKELSNRKRSNTNWNFDVIKTFMMNRAKELFKGKFVLDENNERVFELLCYYFMSDPNFLVLADKMGVKSPSLDKGILMPGNFGTGKTWLMKLFQKNNRQVYIVRNAKDISNAFLQSKEKVIPEEYVNPHCETSTFKNASNDASCFFHPISGLCIDDMGSEQVKNNYGNVSNVIGDLLEHRYADKYTGVLLHGTTNLTAEALKKYYGERVLSRMREIFNFIKIEGKDRRV